MWAKANLFSSTVSTLTTFAFVALGIFLVPPLVRWAVVDAIWSARNGALCREHQDGACWAFVAVKFDYLRYGSYPIAERWRVDAVEVLGAGVIAWLLWPSAPNRAWASLLLFVVYP